LLLGNLLRRLREAGRLEQHGEKRATYYVLAGKRAERS
jgi:hypothetical protein